MRRTRFNWFVVRLACGIALLVPLDAQTQSIRGSIMDARDSTALPGVVIHLLDAANVVVARALTNENGEFLLVAAAPGTYRTRTFRIGFRPVTSAPLQLAIGDPSNVRIVLSAIPLQLQAVRVVGRNACRSYADAGQASQLWDQARTALTAAQLTANARAVAVTTMTYERSIEPVTERVLRHGFAIRSGLTTKPFYSLPADSLRKHGYVVEGRSGITTYYAPDIDVLTSQLFLEDHCLRMVPTDSTRVAIAFEPARGRTDVPEIQGTLWFDPKTLELRTLHFDYANVARYHADAQAGGQMDFVRLSTGAWFIAGWRIRMPVTETRFIAFQGRETRLKEIRVSGGELVSVRRGRDTIWTRVPLVLKGTIVDAGTGQPAPGVDVHISGSELRARSDSAGTFAIANVPPGNYTLQLKSESMEALGVTHTMDITFAEFASLRLPLPALDYTLEKMCPGMTKGFGAIVGLVRLRDDSTPPSDLPVAAEWELIALRNIGNGVVIDRTPRRVEAHTDKQGTFRLCDVPLNTALRLRTPYDQRTDSGAPARLIGNTRAIRVEVTVARRTAAPSGSALVGVVVDSATGAPLLEADIELRRLNRSTRTTAGGRFEFIGIPVGTHELTIRRLGYAPRDPSVRVGAGNDTIHRFALQRVHALDSVAVTAKRTPIPGFDDRRLTGTGHAVTREDLARQEHRRMADILTTVPGLRALRGGTGQAWVASGRGTNSLNRPRMPDRTSALQGARPGCYADVYLDGTLVYGGDGGGSASQRFQLFDVNSLTPSTLEAIEFFAGPAQTPAQFNRTGSNCGVLLLWTRRP